MKKILGLGIVALLVMALVGGGTWAYFNDVETSGENILTAGTLNLGLGNSAVGTYNGSVNGTWFVSSNDWAPGSTQTGTLYIKNNGTIAMNTVSINFSYSTVNTAGRPTTISGSPWTTDPTDYFDKMLYVGIASLNGTANVSALETQTLFSLNNTAIPLGVTLAPGMERTLAITWGFLPTATNGCQGNSVNITATVTGTQN